VTAGVDTIQINSGGQDAVGEGNRRTGSTRHDRGRAADLQCVVEGTTLTFTDQSGSIKSHALLGGLHHHYIRV
jgi:hypothetical protein